MVERYLKALYPRNKEKVEELSKRMMEKYGVHAAELLKQAVCTPKYLNRDLGKPLQSSVKTVDFLLSDEVDMAKVAKALKISEEELANKAEMAVSEPVVAEKGDEKTETRRAMKQQRVKADERSKKPIATSGEIVSSKQGLMDACWDVFGYRRSTGLNLEMHLDSKGYPTIGAGHLVMTTKPTAEDRKRHIERMSKIGIPPAVAAREFDAVANALKTHSIKVDKRNVIISPKLTKITQAQVRKLFAVDIEGFYEDALKNFPDLHKYPIELQTLIVHTGYHCGSINTLKRRCGKDLTPENIAKHAADIRLSEKRHSPNSVCELDSAFKVLDLELPDKAQAIIRQHPGTYADFQKIVDKMNRTDYSRR